MSVFGEEFTNDWPLNDFVKNLTYFGQELLQKCLNIQKPKDKNVNIQEFIRKSNEFPIKFPIDTCRVKTQPAENHPIIQEQIASAYPLLHERVLFLILSFLEHKLKYDNPNACENCKNWQKQYETQFFQLTESVNQLKGSITELAVTTVQQNTIVMEALATQKLLIEKLVGKEKKEEKVRQMFPLQTVDDLTNLNMKIDEANRAVYIRCMSALLKGQLHKTLTEVFSVEVILACNMDGIHGKLSFKTFKRLFDALMDALRANGEENPEKSIRNGLKLIKKRHFQAICVNKKKEIKIKNEPVLDMEEDSEYILNN